MVDLSLSNDIRVSKKIIRNQQGYNDCRYKKRCQIPLLGTENTKELLNKLDCSYDDTLIIGGSADQSLEVVKHGGKNIFLFDINRLTKYGTSLRYAAILALDYNEFMDFYGFNKSEHFSEELYAKVRNYLDADCRFYWDNLFKTQDKNRIFGCLFDAENHGLNREIYWLSIYFESEYYKIKAALVNVQIKFNCFNLKDIGKMNFKEESIDFAYLSNIYNYLRWSPYKYVEFLEQRIVPLLKEKGKAMVYYAYGIYGNAVGCPTCVMSYKDSIDALCSRLDRVKGVELEMYPLKLTEYGWVGYDKDLALVLKRK